MSDPAPVRPVSPDTSDGPDPLIIDLGKQRRKDVKRLREGSGPLVEEVAACLRDLRESGQITRDAAPVVVVVRERKKKKTLWPLR